MPRTRPILAPGEVHLRLDANQQRDFERCAYAAGMSLRDWIVQCAQVQAANAIDALQAEERRRRRTGANAELNAKHREQRRRRREAEERSQ